MKVSRESIKRELDKILVEEIVSGKIIPLLDSENQVCYIFADKLSLRLEDGQIVEMEEPIAGIKYKVVD